MENQTLNDLISEQSSHLNDLRTSLDYERETVKQLKATLQGRKSVIEQPHVETSQVSPRQTDGYQESEVPNVEYYFDFNQERDADLHQIEEEQSSHKKAVFTIDGNDLMDRELAI